MNQIFLLSKEDIALAKEEVLALAGTKDYRIEKNVLILDTDKDLSKRLAYCQKIYKSLFSCEYADFIQNMQDFDWPSVYKENFCVRMVNLVKGKKPKYEEKDLAGYVWRAVELPSVNLKDSKTQIEVIFTKNKIFCGLLKAVIGKGFADRRAHLRPALHPGSLSPKLARACVNLTGIEQGQLLVDPFCGVGGILIEAGLIGIKTIGYDINEVVLKKAKTNLDFYKIKNYKLENKDATKLKDKIDYIVTDLPYARSTKISDKLETLYLNFLKNLEKILQKTAVVAFPDFVDEDKILKQTKFKVKNKFTHYLHKNLSKTIIVLSK